MDDFEFLLKNTQDTIPRPWHYRSGTLLWGRCSLRPTAVCLAHLSRTLGRFPSKNPTHSSAFFQDFPAQTESINSVWFGRSYFMTFPWRISGIFSPSPLDHAHFEVTSPLELATCRASQGLLRQFCGKGFIGFLPQLLAANRALAKTSENADVVW